MELAIEQEADCVFWRTLFNQDFAKKLKGKLEGGNCSLKLLYDLFKKGINWDEGNQKRVTFDWMSPSDLLRLSDPDFKPDGQQESDDRILIMAVLNLETNQKINIPFPLRRDFNPPPDLFRNTIKRLRKYINFLKKDRRPSAKSNNTQMFITDAPVHLKQESEDQSNYSTQSGISAIQLENKKLRGIVEELMVDNERLKNDTGAVKLDSIIHERAKLEKEVNLLRRRTDDLELECAANAHLKSELKKKEKELKELKALLEDFEVSKKLNVPMKQITGSRYKRQKASYTKNRSIKKSFSKNRFPSNNKIIGYNKQSKGYKPPARARNHRIRNVRRPIGQRGIVNKSKGNPHINLLGRSVSMKNLNVPRFSRNVNNSKYVKKPLGYRARGRGNNNGRVAGRSRSMKNVAGRKMHGVGIKAKRFGR